MSAEYALQPTTGDSELTERDLAILDFERTAPAAHEAHPRTEHWAPLYVALGAAAGTNSSGDSAKMKVVDVKSNSRTIKIGT